MSPAEAEFIAGHRLYRADGQAGFIAAGHPFVLPEGEEGRGMTFSAESGFVRGLAASMRRVRIVGTRSHPVSFRNSVTYWRIQGVTGVTVVGARRVGGEKRL